MTILLLLITFAGGIAVYPMPDMATCKAMVEQVMDGNRPPRLELLAHQRQRQSCAMPGWR